MMTFPINRSNSSIAFDSFFNPNAPVTDIFEDFFEPSLGSPDAICDNIMSEKSGMDLIDDFLSSISDSSSSPNSPSCVDHSIDSPPPVEYCTDSYDDGHGKMQIVDHGPKIESKFDKMEYISTVSNPQMAQPMIIDEATISQLVSQYDADQIVVTNGDDEKIIYIVDKADDRPRVEHIPFVKNEHLYERETESPIELFTPDHPSDLKLPFRTTVKTKKEQNRKASKRYRDKKRGKETALEDEMKTLLAEKHACEIEVAKIKSRNDCLADQIERKFAHLLQH